MKKYIAGFTIGVLLSVSVSAFAKSGGLWDVTSTAWYARAVTNLMDIGVISGYSDGSFKPGQTVTRAEVAVMLNRMKEYVDAKVEGKTVPAAVAPFNTPVIPATPAAQTGSCSALATPNTNRTITVSNYDELSQAVTSANASGNTTIILKDGTYPITKQFWITGNNIVFKSESGNRSAVVLNGGGMVGGQDSVFHIFGDNVTIADMTVGWVAHHPIQIHGEMDADATVIHNVHFVDGYEQLLKITYDPNDASKRSDNGIVECSLFDYTAGVGPQYYIGGVDAHNAKNWTVRNNTFKNISSPTDELAEHAIHFWSNSENTLVENNTIINSDRGIGFGMGNNGRGHIGGIIRNNMIYHNATRGDAGITLESATNAQVYNNTIFFENEYPNAIEYRFSSTNGVNISKNLTNRAIKQRDSASGTIVENKTDASASLFIAPQIGDLHLNGNASGVIGIGARF